MMFFSDSELNTFENTNTATPAMHAEKYSYLNILLLIGEYITFSHNIPARSSTTHKLATPYLTWKKLIPILLV